jgi:hypothetical protein
MRLKKDNHSSIHESNVSFDIGVERLRLAQHFNKKFPAQSSDRPAAPEPQKRPPRDQPGKPLQSVTP